MIIFIGNVKVYGIIYRIRNKVNNKVYIGQCIYKFKRRYKGKRWWDYTHNIHLKNSYDKYGAENFEVTEILDIAFSKSELNIKEQLWILRYNAINPKFGYNKSYGGNTNIYTEETRTKMSIRSKERWNDKSYRDNLMKKLKLITSSSDYRENMSISLKNSIKHKNSCSTDSFRLKQSNKMKNNWSDENFSNLMKLKYKQSWTDKRKLEQSIRSKKFHENIEYKEKISKIFKERWNDEKERERLCNSMKKIYLIVNIETNSVKEFLGREELANYIGKSVSYVKTRLNGKLHNEKYKIIRKSDYINQIKDTGIED